MPSSIALSYFKQSLRGLTSIQHALLSQFHWTQHQNQPNALMLPLGGHWILPVETIEAHKEQHLQATPGIGVDEVVDEFASFLL